MYFHTLKTGIVTMMVHPLPGEVISSTFPPKLSARLKILIMPKPLTANACSNPLPLLQGFDTDKIRYWPVQHFLGAKPNNNSKEKFQLFI